MLDLSQYPRCEALAKDVWVKLGEKGLTHYWLAVALADSFTTRELVDAGVDFDKKDGHDLLRRLEKILDDRHLQKLRRGYKYMKSYKQRWRGLR